MFFLPAGRASGYTSSMTKPVFRFAPSPNGRLHLGHAYSALLNQQLAERHGGRLLLRLEDIDTQRCTPELARLCLEDLAWLGLRWQQPVRVQSQHFADYQRAAQTLKEQGLLYPCFCTRSQVQAEAAAQDPDGAPIYSGHCRHLPQPERERRMRAGEPHSWRLDVQAALARHPGPHRYRHFSPQGDERLIEVNPGRWGDAILLRKDTPASYHLAVVTDDALQGVTHVVRGLDLEAATDLHVLLQALLGLPVPQWRHHPLLLDESGRRLAKRDHAATIAALREAGVTPADVRRLAGLPDP